MLKCKLPIVKTYLGKDFYYDIEFDFQSPFSCELLLHGIKQLDEETYEIHCSMTEKDDICETLISDCKFPIYTKSESYGPCVVQGGVFLTNKKSCTPSQKLMETGTLSSPELGFYAARTVIDTLKDEILDDLLK